MKFVNRLLTGPIFSLIAFAFAPVAAFANVVGTDAQNFNPTTSGLDFVTVQSSETLKPGIINVGVFLNFAVNALPYLENSPQGRLDFNDSLLGLDLNAGVGLTSNWDVGISLPQIIDQSVEDQVGARGEFSQTGATEIRINSKYRLAGDATGGVAVVGTANFNRIENNPFTGQNSGPTFGIELAADTTMNRLAYGGNIGYRIRNPGTRVPNSVIEPLSDQITASAATSYHFPEHNTKLIGEIFGSLPAKKTSADVERSLSSLEVLVGAKYDVTTNLAFHAGGGTGVGSGLASPDWRLYTGLNYTFGPVFSSAPTSATGDDVYLTQVADDTPSGVTNIERFRTQKILFEFDSDQMIGRYDEVLRELAEHLGSSYQSLLIEGHTDSIGAAGYNQRLSLRRADAIKRYLVSRLRLDGRKISTVGFGETRPIADNGNYQGRQENRRVEFVIRR